MFDLYRIQPFMPILLVSENVVGGRSRPCRTAAETYAAAKYMLNTFRDRCPGATTADCIIDPGISPIGSDSEGNLHRLIAALELIHTDPDFTGAHVSVGLSNFTVMLPTKARTVPRLKARWKARFSPRPCLWDWTWSSVR